MNHRGDRQQTAIVVGVEIEETCIMRLSKTGSTNLYSVHPCLEFRLNLAVTVVTAEKELEIGWLIGGVCLESAQVKSTQ